MRTRPHYYYMQRKMAGIRIRISSMVNPTVNSKWDRTTIQLQATSSNRLKPLRLLYIYKRTMEKKDIHIRYVYTDVGGIQGTATAAARKSYCGLRFERGVGESREML